MRGLLTAAISIAIGLLTLNIERREGNPTEFTKSNEPRKWVKTTLTYAWVGSLPQGFPEPYRTNRTMVNALIDRAFNAWSSDSIPQVRLRFQLSPIVNAEHSIQTQTDVEQIERRDIVVVFMDGYDSIVSEPYDSVGAAYERDEPRDRKQPLTPMLIAIDNNHINSVVHFQAVLLHEIGHALGLDHSSAHWQGASVAFDPIRWARLPVMNTNPTTRRDLHPDDRAALAELYQPPREEVAPQLRKDLYGWIRGDVVYDTNPTRGVKGVQVIAAKLVNGRASANDIDNQETFVGITPYAHQDDTSRIGTFRITAPPGEYRLFVRHVEPPFNLFRAAILQNKAREVWPIDVFVSPGAGTLVPHIRVITE